MRLPHFPLLAAAAAAAAAALLTSCTVYAPMQPTVSTVTQAGQLELTGSAQLSGRVEGTAVYSPLPHVLLAGGGTYRPRLGGTTYFATRQWEAGAGTYWLLGQHWLLTGEGGYGYAGTERMWQELFGNSPELRARYSKVFGQVSLGYLRKQKWSGGAVYRFSQLHFDASSYYTPYYQGTTTNTNMGRHEVLLYGRHELHLGRASRWQLQGAMGFSASNLARRADTDGSTFEINRNRQPVLMMSGGLVYRPAWGRASRAATGQLGAH